MKFFNKNKSKNRSPRIAFLISGRGSNMSAILRKILDKKLHANPVLVFSDKKSALGLEKAQKFNIPTKTFALKDFNSKEAYEKELVNVLKKAKVEWVVCAGYMKILGSTMVDAFEERIVNIHPALLPSFPGLHAQKQALEYGVQFSGCTVHFVDKGVDTGPIILQQVVTVLKNDTEASLSKRILKTEHDSYWQALKKVFKGYSIQNRKVI